MKSSDINIGRWWEPVDIHRVVAMLLVHDIGEIDAGDTFVYAETKVSDQKAAEAAAVTRMFGLLPEAQTSAFLALWQGFEAGWRQGQPCACVGRVGPPIRAGCPALWSYLEARLEVARAEGWFGIESPA